MHLEIRHLEGPPDLVAQLASSCSQTPHRQLQGRSHSLVTFTPEMFAMLDEIEVAARHHVTVLLVGETGSGKTYLARLIHELSARRDHRFLNIACGALPPDLIESELFGYVKGAFTGADRDREGKFAAAGSGTLLLDEIDVLPLEQQAKLLRVIEAGEYEPVGSNETQHSQARLIVASNHNLEELVAEGNFRLDLYYRLNVLCFRLLPLRERPWDIEHLARTLALQHSNTHGIPLRTIEPAVFEVLRVYPWPGNIRELENMIRRAVLYCHRGVLRVSDLPNSVRAVALGVLPAAEDSAQLALRSAGTRAGLDSDRPALHVSRLRPGRFGRLPLRSIRLPTILESSPASAAVAATLEARVDVLEQQIIEECLRRNNFRRKQTAAELGISRVTLYNKMKKFGLM
jgi:transcriptional regulator with PAS, ATPase and Fis domain